MSLTYFPPARFDTRYDFEHWLRATAKPSGSLFGAALELRFWIEKRRRWTPRKLSCLAPGEAAGDFLKADIWQLMIKSGKFHASERTIAEVRICLETLRMDRDSSNPHKHTFISQLH